MNGRDTSLEDFLDPEVLDTLTLKTNEVLEVKTFSRHLRVLSYMCEVQVLRWSCVCFLSWIRR